MDKAKTQILWLFLAWICLISPLWADGDPAYAEPGGVLTYLTNSQSVTVSNPSIVTVAFTEFEQYNQYTDYEDMILGTPTDLGWNVQYIVVGDSYSVQVNGPSGQIAGFTMTTTMGPGIYDGQGGAGLTVTGTGSSLTLKGSTATDPSYSVGVATNTANVNLAGSFNCPSNSQVGELSGGNGNGYTATTYSTGTFTFYAPTAGTYTVQAINPAPYHMDATMSTDGPQGYGVISSDYFASFIMSEMRNGGITLTSATAQSAGGLPSGSISVTRAAGGAGGVTLQWTVTPPTH